MTTGPSAGPASAYPTLRTPALICFNGPNEVFVPGLIAGAPAGLDCAAAEPVIANGAAASAMAAVLMRRRRSMSICWDICFSPIEGGALPRKLGQARSATVFLRSD